MKLILQNLFGKKRPASSLLVFFLFFPRLSCGGILHDNLEESFSDVPTGTALSFAAPVLIDDGAICQTLFWPALSGDADGKPVKWLGEVHALLVDENGDIYEDTNHNYALDIGEDEKVEIIVDGGELKGCYGGLPADGTCSGITKPFSQVAFLWSAADNLNSIPLVDISVNRSDLRNPVDSRYISDSVRRNIFTWNDLDNDGIVDQSGEILPFEVNWGGLNIKTSVGDENRGVRNSNIVEDFGVATQREMNALINWVRGMDQEGLRSRSVRRDLGAASFSWRLGDIVNSTPVMVGRPAENYHLTYKDKSYAVFVARYRNRRKVIYFGGNDGMLHAVNGGFYQNVARKFCLAEDCETVAGAPQLGAELWAYIPYNLAPHLKCLADPDYNHEYLVDLKPSIFDMRIFADDADHPGGWGTILVGGMRLGGLSVAAKEIDQRDGLVNMPADRRVFSSSYFFLDITNPEKPPVLLGEMTHLDGVAADSRREAEVGFTTSSPVVVPVVTDALQNEADWYLVFGSGPTEANISSDQKPTLFVMPMEWLAGIGASDHELRFPLYEIAVENNTLQIDGGAAYTLPGAGYGFVGNPVVVDFELLPDYKANVVYFGTSEKKSSSIREESSTAWRGKMYRLIIGDHTFAGGKPFQAGTTPKDWRVNVLIDVEQPVTAAATIGWDQQNFWVYFGTGPFLSQVCAEQDDSQQSFYGIKEPMQRRMQSFNVGSVEAAYCDENFSWETVEKRVFRPNAPPGRAGLLNVTPISVAWNGMFQTTTLRSRSGNSARLNDKVYQSLINAISGVGRGCEIESNGLDGWYRDFQDKGERYIGPPMLLGGLLTFTSFVPEEGRCLDGHSNLYALYYQTGVAWQKPVFEKKFGLQECIVAHEIDLGPGLASEPRLHVGVKKGVQKIKKENGGEIVEKTEDKVVLQISSGVMVKVEQPVIPEKKYKSGRQSWFEGIPKTPGHLE